jgi:hypothetical protein
MDGPAGHGRKQRYDVLHIGMRGGGKAQVQCR